MSAPTLAGLESGLPVGTRVYLVVVGDEGERRAHPVPTDLESIRRLDASQPNNELLLQVHAFCERKLHQRNVHVASPHVKANERAIHLLTEIADAANDADRACYLFQGESEDDTEAHERRLRGLACHMGWVAELALVALGHPPCDTPRKGSAERWLLPPVCNDEDTRK